MIIGFVGIVALIARFTEKFSPFYEIPRRDPEDYTRGSFA